MHQEGLLGNVVNFGEFNVREQNHKVFDIMRGNLSIPPLVG